MTPRFGADFELLDRFIQRLRALTPAQWEGLARSLDHLRGDDVRTMWRRARQGLGLARKAPIISGVFATLSVTGQLIDEFAPQSADPRGGERVRAYMATRPSEERERWIRFESIGEIAERNRPGDDVVVEVLRTASMGLQFSRAPGFTRADVEGYYAPLEPFIPLDSL